jgi:ferrous iron transport protein B
MPIKIALAGNPNCGKTTLFNALTGSNQYVGNWPGVTVEKKEGALKGHSDVIVTDLPGIYSLSPYSPEEVAARNYLIDERPDVILNIVDGGNLERNLFLTTQLVELGIPVVVAVNMMDRVHKHGDKIDTVLLAKELGCKVAEMSAINGNGVKAAADAAVAAAGGERAEPQHAFSGRLEHALAHIEEAVSHRMPHHHLPPDHRSDPRHFFNMPHDHLPPDHHVEPHRFFIVKLFERDETIARKLKLHPDQIAHIEEHIKRCEKELEDDSESIVTAERYAYIESVIKDCVKLKNKGGLSASDKIDKIVTNRYLALPIFTAVMFIVYFVSVTTVGSFATDWANEGLFGDGWHLFGIGTGGYDNASEKFDAGESADKPDPSNFGVWVPGVPVIASGVLASIHCPEWLRGLIVDGIIAGVGAVLGFVPQMFVLFIFLAFLEACGYMARVAFIMDRFFKRIGLSGKSFIPFLIGTGCSVPGIMATRTIESDRDRRATIIITSFIPCSAKLPVIALIAGAIFGGAWWVAPSAYFAGITAVVCSGIVLKKAKFLAGETAPFVMELTGYNLPTVKAILASMWDRGWSFIKKAGTIVLAATIFVWFASSFGFGEDGFGFVDMDESLLAKAGGFIAPLFIPLGWGSWEASVAAITGLVAKENLVGTFAILHGFAQVSDDGAEMWGTFAKTFSALAAYSFLIFNLLCAPCVAAMGAIKAEMASWKWFFIAVGYQCGFAYAVSLCIYQFGMMFKGSFGVWAIAAFLLLGGFLYLLFRPARGVRPV